MSSSFILVGGAAARKGNAPAAFVTERGCSTSASYPRNAPTSRQPFHQLNPCPEPPLHGAAIPKWPIPLLCCTRRQRRSLPVSPTMQRNMKPRTCCVPDRVPVQKPVRTPPTGLLVTLLLAWNGSSIVRAQQGGVSKIPLYLSDPELDLNPARRVKNVAVRGPAELDP